MSIETGFSGGGTSPLPSQVGLTRLGHQELNSGTPEFRRERGKPRNGLGRPRNELALSPERSALSTLSRFTGEGK
jgi:hypothetical protein